MPEKPKNHFIIPSLNPNPPEQPDANIKSLLPSVNTLYQQIKDIEAPNAKQSDSYSPLTNSEIKDILIDSLQQVVDIEKAARNPDRWNIPWEIASDTTLIVDFSAPGTYSRAKKNDKYSNYDWSWGMDRKRTDTAAAIGISIASQATGQDFSEFTLVDPIDNLNPALTRKRDLVRQALSEKGIRFLYLGTQEEGNAIRQVIESPKSFIPANLVTVLDENIDNTVGQVKALGKYLKNHMRTPNNQDGFIPPKSNIIIPMGIQAVRAFPMFNQFNSIPGNINVYLFPIATPAGGIHEYASLETKGRIYYTLTGQASRESIPYTLLGK